MTERLIKYRFLKKKLMVQKAQSNTFLDIMMAMTKAFSNDQMC